MNGERGLQDFMTASGVSASSFLGENAGSKRANFGRGILNSFDRQAELEERLVKPSENDSFLGLDGDLSENLIPF